MFCDYHLFIKGTVLIIMKTLLQVLLFTLGSVTYANTETVVECKRDDWVTTFWIDDAEEQVRINPNPSPTKLVVFHEDYILFRYESVGRPYTEYPHNKAAEGVIILHYLILNRITGKLREWVALTVPGQDHFDTQEAVSDCDVKGNKF